MFKGVPSVNCVPAGFHGAVGEHRGRVVGEHGGCVVPAGASKVDEGCLLVPPSLERVPKALPLRQMLKD